MRLKRTTTELHTAKKSQVWNITNARLSSSLFDIPIHLDFNGSILCFGWRLRTFPSSLVLAPFAFPFLTLVGIYWWLWGMAALLPLAMTGKVLVDPVVFCQQSVALASPSALDFAAWTFALAPTQTLGGAAPSLNWSPMGSSFCGDYIVLSARRCLLFLWGKRELKHFCSVVFISNQLSFRGVFPVESHSRINLFGPLRSLSPNWLRINVTSWSI